MALSLSEQWNTIIEERSSFLIVFPAHASGDAIGSSLALYGALRAKGKKVDIVSPEYSIPKEYFFLPDAHIIQKSIPKLQHFVIRVHTENAGLEDISYKKEGDTVSILLSPKHGTLGKEHITTAQSEFLYDAIILLGAEKLEDMNELYHTQRAFFESTLKINIDIRAENERFGNINIINPALSTISEHMLDLITHMGSEYLTAHVATALLTGIIAKTHGFRANTVGPQTLAAASRLIRLGAKRDDIVAALFHTKTVSTLQLWGRALSSLTLEKETCLATATITRDDFTRSGTDETDLPGVVDELIQNAPEAKHILLIYECTREITGTIHAILYTDRSLDAMHALEPWAPIGNPNMAEITFKNSNLKQSTEMLTAKINGAIKEKNLAH